MMLTNAPVAGTESVCLGYHCMERSDCQWYRPMPDKSVRHFQPRTDDDLCEWFMPLDLSSGEQDA